MTSQPVKNKKYDTRRSRVAGLLFFTRCDVFCDLLQYTRTEKCNLFVLYNKNSNGLLKDFGGMKKEKNKSADVIWRGFDVICVCPLIDHGQQPIKMHPEVTLLYKKHMFFYNTVLLKLVIKS